MIYSCIAHTCCRTDIYVIALLPLNPNLAAAHVSSTLACMLSRPAAQVMAKGAMIRSAAKRGVEWEKYVRDHQTHLATYEAIKKEVEDPNFNYPEYCLKPIHGCACDGVMCAA